MTAKLKALYSVGELAKLAGLSRHQMRRIVDRHMGRGTGGERSRRMVPVAEFRAACPELWESILTVQSARGAARG